MCGQKYRVRMFHRFSLDWDRLCSCRVVNNACELCMLVLTLCATIFAYTLLDMKVGLGKRSARVCGGE